MKIGHVIKAMRLEKDLRLEAMALDLETATSTLSRVESGQRTPSLELLEKIAGRLGVRVSDIFKAAEAEDAARLREEPASYDALGMQARKLFQSLNDENRRLGLELLKALTRQQAEAERSARQGH